jgi:hypothetical protein
MEDIMKPIINIKLPRKHIMDANSASINNFKDAIGQMRKAFGDMYEIIVTGNDMDIASEGTVVNIIVNEETDMGVVNTKLRELIEQGEGCYA